MYINNYKDLKEAYKMINFFNREYQKIEKMEGEYQKINITVEEQKNTLVGIEKLIIEYKQAIREYQNNIMDNYDLETRLIENDNYGNYTKLIKLPHYIKTYDEAELYFADNLKLHCIKSMYDCTGQHFTIWKKIFKRNNNFMVYHRVGIDI